jgi:ketosteroid isomerase-like protein
MASQQQLIETFYQAFARLDYATMASCYHPQARFSDPAFTLQGADIGVMWQMLCQRAQHFQLNFTVTQQDGLVRAHWEPRYLFSQTGRQVHNIIDAEFEFRDGLIYRHRDHFSFWRWSRQALGLPGLLLGWTPWLRKKVQQQAAAGLRAFTRKAQD